MNSDEPVQKKKSSNDESIHFKREILEHARGKYGKRHEDRSKFIIIGIYTLVAVVVLIGPMLLDPLFLYVPIINENVKCVALDEKLKNIAIILRLFIDLPYLLKVIRHMLPTWCELGILEDLLDEDMLPKSQIHCVLAVLPIPQIIILILLPTTRYSRSLNIMKFLNSLILLQYVARACPLFKICKKVNRKTRENSEHFARKKRIWIIGALNFIMYILASHVLGAFWYFYSVQRERDCWISTCRSENGCDLSTLQCANTMFKNVTLLHDLCPTNPPNQTVYDFGIFVDALQSGIVRTTDFPQKILMCFSWGLRNLSSFASNLNTSGTHAWETVFVIFISISGLVLFIYLLGHLQIFMQAIRRTSDIWRRMEVKRQQIAFMLSEYDLPEMKVDIEKLVRGALEADEDNPAENIFSLLPPELGKLIKPHLFMATLKKLPRLENIDREVLNAIMEDLEPVNYADGSYIIREGEPLDRMLFITQGIALAYKTSTTGGKSGSSSITHLEKGEVYGRELTGWAATSTPFSGLPISDKTVKSHEKVEVFAIRAARLQRIASDFSKHFNTELPRLADSTPVETHVEIH